MTTVLVIAKTTLGEALRKKILLTFMLVAIAMIVFSVSFAYFTYREELTIIKSMGLGVIAIAGMFISVVLGINLIPTEIERRTIFTILSKPVHRNEFILGKYLGALLTIFVNLAFMTVVFMALVAWKNHWQPDYALLYGVMMIYFQLVILTSVALLFSVFATPIVNFFLTSATYIIGSLSEITEALSKGDDKGIITKSFYSVLHYLVPQFANFFVQNPLIHPEVTVRNDVIYYAHNIVYALVFAAALLIVTILVFDRRDM